MKTLKYLLLFYFIPFLVSAQNTVVDVIVNSDIHNTLETAVIAADLAGTLSGDGPFTVFAPTDDAFAALPDGVLDGLLADPSGALTDVLLYHALAADVRSSDLMDGQIATTINGKDVLVSITSNGVFINNAQVTVADIVTDNGVVHVIDAVLIPPTTTVVDVIVNSDIHNILEAAVLAADLAGTLSGDGPFTVFAPTDAAFAALPDGVLDALLTDPSGELTDILLYHVLAADVQSTGLTDGQMATTINGKDITVTINADGIFINDAQVIVADIVTDNGVVHVIDAVLIPPTTTVVDVIVNSDIHNTLEAAVIAADLAGTLSGDGPFTVFAPTDAAFAALPDGVLDALLADPSGALTDVLLYHVLAADVRSTDLTDGQIATTINGADVTVTINSDGIFINNAQVILADIATDNGVVHVIDAVLVPTPPTTTTVVDVIVNSDIHNTLEAAVIAADLAGTLSGDGPFTVFAPTDAAFAALPDGVVDALLADPSGDLTDILLYHVLAADVRSTDLTDGQMATTINGKDITVTINADGIFINDAQVIVADIVTDNGVVHVIDAVLIPPTTTVVDVIVNSDIHNTLEAAVIAADLVETLNGDGPFTVFAPTDAAFAALPDGLLDALLADPSGDLTDILLYHVLAGDVRSTDLFNGQTATTILGQDVTITINDNGIFINNAQVIVADIVTDNGVVHVIDAVLVPTLTTTVVDVIVNSDIHNTLEAAVIAADLVETLSGAGPFTVFAPTDAAFAALPDGVVDALLADPSGDLTDILLYHVLAADVRSTDLTDGQMATTINGKDITVTINADGIFINDAQVIVADIVTDNGVVHVIDAVLIPPTTTVVDVIVNSDIHNTLEAAVIAADLVETLSGDGPFTVFAPTDAAFAALPDGLLDDLLADPSGDLTTILLYHVLAGDVRSTDLFDGQTATTILGQEVTVTINADGIFINDAQVIVADIVTDNGVVHVIDAVLVPDLTPQTAKVQFIHNAEFETIRVFAGGEQIENFLAYKTATDYIEVPAGTDIEIELRSRKSYLPADPVFSTLTFEPNKTYVVGIVGTFDTSDPYPVELVSFDRAIETAPDDIVGVQLLHGSYDAPTIDIVSSGSSIFDDVSFGEFGDDFLLIPADDGYRIDVTTADNSATVASYELNIGFWKRKSLTIFATGSLTEGTFQPWVALSTGGTYPLPEWTGLFASNINTTAEVGFNTAPRMLVAPNPAVDYTILEFTTQGESPVRINLFNGMGQLVRSKELGTLDAGVYREEIQLNGLPEGTYFIKTYLNGKSEAMSIMKTY